jgi:TolB-like protein
MMTALEAVTTPSGVPRASGTTRSLRLPLIAAGVLVLAGAGAYAVRSRGGEAASSTVATGADVIAVMPLSAVSDSSLTRLGQDLVVTLSTNLDGVGSLHTVDAVTLLMRTRKSASPMALAEARTMARELGARSVLTGTLINQGDQVLASVALHLVGSDSAIAKASALASPRDIAAITDSLTWRILQQVWRRGTPPSPLLSGLTTRSVDALRAFLDGERHFQRLDVPRALADYRRAFEADSNFVQALLRHHFVSAWALTTPDSAVHARLIALKERLPERERLWVETSELRIPTPQRIARWKALAERYPDYPPVLMGAADPILHSGPLYGIPISEARSYLDRLEELMPDHADTRFHVALLAMATGEPDSIAVTLLNAAPLMEAPFGPMLELTGRVYEAKARGAAPLAPELFFPAARRLAMEVRGSSPFYLLAGTLGLDVQGTGQRLAALERIRAAGIYSGDVDLISSLGEGVLRSARGDWSGGQRARARGGGPDLVHRPHDERTTRVLRGVARRGGRARRGQHAAPRAGTVRERRQRDGPHRPSVARWVDGCRAG